MSGVAGAREGRAARLGSGNDAVAVVRFLVAGVGDDADADRSAPTPRLCGSLSLPPPPIHSRSAAPASVACPCSSRPIFDRLP